jgi:ABC-type phosphate/phosphonate transport system substrate-binding protein
VREASGWRSLEEAFGHRFGWMAENSQSGFNAPRAHLAKFVSASRPALFAESVGPLGTPARTLDALRAGTVDIVALDGYYLDLVRHHEPGRLAGLRRVGSTPWTPIPLLVAAPGTDEGIVQALRAYLLQVHGDPGSAGAMADVLVSRFATPDVDAYGVFEALAREAQRRGYAAIR